MAFSCTRPKTKDEVHRNVPLEKRILQSSKENTDLSNMNLTDDDIPVILRKAIKKKKLTTLSLAKNEITANGIRILVDGLKTNKTLTHIFLSSNPIGDEGIGYVLELIRNNRSLNLLSLADTEITDRGVKMIVDVLGSDSTSLRCLDLRSNKFITDSSVDVILQMADQNQILSTCRLNDCGLSEQGKEKLQETKSINW